VYLHIIRRQSEKSSIFLRLFKNFFEKNFYNRQKQPAALPKATLPAVRNTFLRH